MRLSRVLVPYLQNHVVKYIEGRSPLAPLLFLMTFNKHIVGSANFYPVKQISSDFAGFKSFNRCNGNIFPLHTYKILPPPYQGNTGLYLSLSGLCRVMYIGLCEIKLNNRAVFWCLCMLMYAYV